MGLQLIVQAENRELILVALDAEGEQCELFQIEGELWGLSIPMKVVDAEGESQLRARLSILNVYDLHVGEWRYARA